MQLSFSARYRTLWGCATRALPECPFVSVKSTPTSRLSMQRRMYSFMSPVNSMNEWFPAS